MEQFNMQEDDCWNGRDFIRENYFEKFREERCNLLINYQCNEDPPANNTVVSSNDNLVNYANITPNDQESFDYNNINHTKLYNPNNYYNVTQLINHDQPFIANANSRSTTTTLQSRNRRPKKRPSPIVESMGEKVDDLMQILRICQRLGYNMDSAPSIPMSRNYTIVGNQKIAFPQKRQLRNEHYDHATGIRFMAGEIVKVIGPSHGLPRGRLQVQHLGYLIDVPHYQFFSLSEAPDLLYRP